MKKALTLLISLLFLLLVGCSDPYTKMVNRTLKNGNYCKNYKSKHLLETDSDNHFVLVKCKDIHLILYCSEHWANKYCKVIHKYKPVK